MAIPTFSIRFAGTHLRVTLPVESLEAAGLRPGDEVVIEAEGVDRIVVHRRPRTWRSASSTATS
jgi:bifunctional DNA-binding transcriptional regulator/antitoxin component of YhaV-PrlF toxin-antitoxin module